MNGWGSDTYNVTIDLTKTKGSFDFTQFDKAIEVGFDKGVKELTVRVRQKLVDNMVALGLGGSNLINNIVVEDDGLGIIVTVASEYAMYVEYGTGIVGSENPHPHPWEYDINAYGEDGWIYKGDDGKLHWTAGQPSRPFMYNTWLWASRSATQIIRKNIRAEIKKIKGVESK